MNTNTIKITPIFAAIMQTIIDSGKTPWVIINEDYAVNVSSGRNEARQAKAVGGLAGSIMKASDVKFQTVDLPKSKKAPVEILRKSIIESPCFIVWDMADNMKDARRKDVIAACVAKGVAFYTARTQYQLWLTSTKA